MASRVTTPADGAAAATVPVYALPEHQVVLSLLPDIENRRLTVSEAAARLPEPHLVPVAINPARPEPLIYFADLGSYEYREWQHIITVQKLAEAGRITDYFSAPAELLELEDLVSAPHRPRGFILHTSRCGSTVLCKALARADGIAVLSQPAVLQHGFWAWITDGWRLRGNWCPENNHLNIKRFRSLVRLLCRPRLGAGYETFIKFISWNSLYVNFIQAAFPGVPALFMYRDPVEVIASVKREASAALIAKGTPQSEFLTGAPASELPAMDTVEYLSRCYAHVCEAILHAQPHPKMLAFSAFAPNVLERILAEAFALHPDQGQLGHMREQFAVYSKDDRNETEYQDDSLLKRETLSADEIRLVESHCDSCWRQLRESAHNVI